MDFTGTGIPVKIPRALQSLVYPWIFAT